MKQNRNSTLFPRVGAAFVAAIAFAASMIAALPALASSVTLSGATGNTCTYTSVTGSASGDFTFVCGSVAPQPGTLSLSTAAVSVPIGGSTTFAINRSSGNSGAVSGNLTVGGAANCTLSVPSVTFADASAAPVPTLVTVTPSPTATNGQLCVVALTAAGGALLGAPATLTVTVVDPDTPVSFQFSSTTSTASFGGAMIPVVVTRTGGTNGSFDVPITIGGTMTTTPTSGGGALLVGGGTLVPTIIAPNSVLTFAPGSQSVTVNYTPPATAPVGVLSPASLFFGLGQPVATPGALPAPVVTQTASLGANTVHSMTVAQSSTCPTTADHTVVTRCSGGTPCSLMKQGQTTAVSLAIGPSTFGAAGYGRYSVGETTGLTNADIQFSLSTCPGDFSRPAPCTKHTNYIGGAIQFYIGTLPPTINPIFSFQYCGLPAGTTQVYLNVRQVKYPLTNPPVASCGAVGYTGTCPFTVEFN